MSDSAVVNDVQSGTVNFKVRSNDLIAVFDSFSASISTLSLDCFDTILWRKSAAPQDVFYDLQHSKSFKKLGFSAELRRMAEVRARQMKVIAHGKTEVDLEEIYLNAFPTLSFTEIQNLIAEEIAIEQQYCFAYEPIINLIRHAHQLHKKIIIVSDTYFNYEQLKGLLKHRLPTDVFAMISKIFCSSDHGRSKVNGLFQDVLSSIKQFPEKILHLGDNLAADYAAARMNKLNSLHFIRESSCVEDMLRMQSVTANFFDPSIRSTRPLMSPLRPVFAMRDCSYDQPESLIGYVSLGAIMFAFGQFILEELKQIRLTKSSVKVAFLMRDGYLPSLVCEQLANKSIGKRIRISRFCSYAASFRSKDDIDRYILEVGISDRFNDMARQLLLPEDVVTDILSQVETSLNPNLTFLNLIHQQDNIDLIVKNSVEYAARLKSHLESELHLKSGDTLVLVDLGYSGTTQRRLTPVFAEMGVEVLGRYLIALRIPGWEHNRKGLIDASWCDDRTMHAMVSYISLLEQLCTSNENSVIDYDGNGNPIYSGVAMAENQHHKLDRIQNECLKFVSDASEFFNNNQLSVTTQDFADVAMAEINRMIFLPTAAELNYLKSFEAEMNLGTTEVLKIFDSDAGLSGLRQRGLMFMERSSKSGRTNYPAELRAASVELSLTLMAQHRFALDMNLKDMVLRHEIMDVVFMRGSESYATQVEALATHDGFFGLWLPANLAVSIQLGKRYQWIQFESLSLIPMASFKNQMESQMQEDAWGHVTIDKMLLKSNHGVSNRLYECINDSSCLTLKLDNRVNGADFVFRLIFRPVVGR